MSSNFFTVKEFLAAKEKYADDGGVIKASIDAVKVIKKAQQSTYYIPIKGRNIAGKQIPLSIKFTKQVLCSNAKIAYGVELKDAKDVRVSFRTITKDDLSKTDYNEEQYDELVESNNEFIKVLDAIADEYLAIVNNELLTYKGEKIAKKDLKPKEIYCFRQSHRDKSDSSEQTDDTGKVPLECPIFRIRINANPANKKLGFYSEKTGHIYTVYDTKKSMHDAAVKTKETGKKVAPKPVVAKIKSPDGKFQDLTVSNAKHFITYMSLTGGTIQFESICLSKSGVSLLCKFRDLYVWRHKPMKISTLNEDDIDAYARIGTGADDVDVEMELEEPTEDADDVDDKPKKLTGKKSNNAKAIAKAMENDDDGEVELNNEPDEHDTEEPEENPVEDIPDIVEASASAGASNDEEEVPKKPKKPVTGGNLKAGTRSKK